MHSTPYAAGIGPRFASESVIRWSTSACLLMFNSKSTHPVIPHMIWFPMVDVQTVLRRLSTISNSAAGVFAQAASWKPILMP